MTISEEMGKKLCALVDDELSDNETDAPLARIKSDNALRQCWERYHLVGDLLKHRELLPARIDLSTDLAQRVSKAIENEPAILAPGTFGRGRQVIRGLAKQVTGFAVAASVTLVVVLGVQYQGESLPGTQQMVANDQIPAPASQVSPVDSRSIPAHQFNKYLVNHNEHVGSTAMRQGVLPYARIVDGAKPTNK